MCGAPPILKVDTPHLSPPTAEVDVALWQSGRPHSMRWMMHVLGDVAAVMADAQQAGRPVWIRGGLKREGPGEGALRGMQGCQRLTPAAGRPLMVCSQRVSTGRRERMCAVQCPTLPAPAGQYKNGSAFTVAALAEGEDAAPVSGAAGAGGDASGVRAGGAAIVATYSNRGPVKDSDFKGVWLVVRIQSKHAGVGG